MKELLGYKFVPVKDEESINKIIEKFGFKDLADMKYQLRGDIAENSEDWSKLTLPINRYELEDDELFGLLPNNLSHNTVFIYGSPEQRVLVCTVQMFLSESGYDEDEITKAYDRMK